MKIESTLTLVAVVLCTCALPLPVVSAQTETETPKPNIIHILTDDLGWQDPVCFDVDGKTPFETPNLDRLADRSRKFTQAYSPSPTCSPSRAAYISGQYPAHTGIYHVLGGKLPRAYSPRFSHINPYYRYRLPLAEMTIPKELEKAGYSTGHVGKWHLGGRSNGFPFPGDYGFDFGYVDDLGKGGTYYPDPEIWGPRKQLRKQHSGLASKMKPDRLSGWATDDPQDPFQLGEDGRPFDKTLDVALKWLDKHHAEPFFLNYCTYYVHSPIQTRDRDRFARYCKKMGLEFPTDPGTINKGLGGKTNPYYATMVNELDWMIGEVISFLEETDDPRNPGHKLVDNTYLFISSDNGGLVERSGGTITDNSPLRGGKQNIHEGGVRVPFIVSGPNVPKGSTCETPVSLIDLYPTFVDLVGLDPSSNQKLDGCDIRPLMEGKDSVARFADGTPRESIFFFYPIELSSASAMRKGKWKIYRNLSPGNNKNPLVELFQLYNDDGSMADIGEEKNMAKEMPDLTTKLLAELDQFLDDANVEYPYKNPDIKSHANQDRVPAVLKRGDQGDKIWVEVETGEKKSKIVEAKLLYTVNGGKFELSRGRRELWFEAPAEIKDGRIEGTVPPGTSHAAFCMRDSEGFLVMSEELPNNQETSYSQADSSIVKHAFPFRPGLFGLIKLAKQAKADLQEKDKSDASLSKALDDAEALYDAGEGTDEQYYATIRGLRKSIRNLKSDTPQAENYHLNLFRQSDAF